MEINYRVNSPLNSTDFINLLNASGLGERRPVDKRDCIEGMLANANLTISAWYEEKLVGIARSMTDFHYACYMSDIAVDKQYQKTGIGKKLIDYTMQELKDTCKLILLAAPQANEYYQPLGFSNNPRGWVLEKNNWQT